MKVLVCGAGQVGSSIARHLASEGNDMTVIDQSPELIRNISDTLDVKAIQGFASHPNVLEQAGASDADLLIAVTQSDEVNMIACQVAHSIFDIPMRIARIRNQNYLNPIWNDLYRRDHMPIDFIISPEIEVAHAIENRLHAPGAVDMVPFAGGIIGVVAVRCMLDCPIIGMSLGDVHEHLAQHTAGVLGMVRENLFILPEDHEKLLPGDDVYVVADSRHMKKVMAVFGHEEREARRVIILGGGNIGLVLAESLEKDPSVKLKLLEVERDRAEYVAERLDRSTVILGNGMEREILTEASIEQTETIIAVTNDDKVNILASLLAKRYGCARAVTLVNNMNYMPLVSTLGIDVVVNPRETTISSILQHVRRGKIKEVHTVHNGQAEIIEAEVVENSPMAGKTLRDINMPKGVRVGAILREGEVIIPDAETVVRKDDFMIILSLAEMVKKIERIFSVQLEYF